MVRIGSIWYRLEEINPHFENAIKYLEPLQVSEDSSKQFLVYYLANSYLNIQEKNYALKSFKQAAEYDYNAIMQEDAYFNYAKLSYELDLRFDNILL